MMLKSIFETRLAVFILIHVMVLMIVSPEVHGTVNFDTQSVITTSAAGARSTAAGDIDRDGDLDVLSASPNDNKIAWYENDGSGGTWTETTITTGADRAWSVAVGDIDGDGDLDVLSASWNDDRIALYRNYTKEGDLADAAGVTEPVDLPSTASTSASAVDIFDYTLLDGGTDRDALSVSRIVVHTSGTGPFTQVTFRLNGPDVSHVTGIYDSGANTLTFEGLAISVADGGSETYTINAYYTDNTGLRDNQTLMLSLDGDIDLTVGSTGSRMGNTTPVSNSTGSTVDIVAAQLVFTSQPSTPVSNDQNMGPVSLEARDDFENKDTDFTETVTLTDENESAETDGPGNLSTTSNGGSLSAAAASGEVTWANLTYDAAAVINLQATTGSLSVESSAVTVQSVPAVTTKSVTSVKENSASCGEMSRPAERIR
ncbi:MAG: VCBS repeat-containing protein [Desulfobacteraceae bacterium]|nr:MAG: VCBS repeat-containing protein [Desulfobacteraceae bacterium]